MRKFLLSKAGNLILLALVLFLILALCIRNDNSNEISIEVDKTTMVVTDRRSGFVGDAKRISIDILDDDQIKATIQLISRPGETQEVDLREYQLEELHGTKQYVFVVRDITNLSLGLGCICIFLCLAMLLYVESTEKRRGV